MISVTLRPGHARSVNPHEKADYMILNWRVSSQPHIWSPPTDLVESQDCYIVRVEIAGMDEKDFNISLDQNILTIQGARLDIPDRRAYHQMEINFGEFITAVELPGPVDVENVSAEYLSGFLVITFQKALPKHIPIHE